MHGLGYWYRFFGVGLLVHIYSSISHSDGVTVVPSFILLRQGMVGRGKDRPILRKIPFLESEINLEKDSWQEK
jgi:hypothetical protein